MKLILIVFCFFCSNSAFAAARYWVNGGTGNWSSTTNWSATSGGASGAVVPTAADDVTFDANGNSNCAVNAAGLAKTLTFTSGYSATITMTNIITVSGNITLGANMVIGGSSGFHMFANATLTSNGKTWPNELYCSGALTITMGDTWTVGSLNVQPAGCIFSGNSINITGSLTAASAITGTTNLNMTGTGTWAGGGNVGVNLTINAPGETITVSGTVSWGALGLSLVYTAGTMSVAGSTLSIVSTGAGTATIDTSGMTWNNVWTNGGGSTSGFQLNSDFKMSGNFTYNNTNNGLIMNGGSVRIGGNLAFPFLTNGTHISGTSTYIMSGASGTSTFSMPSVTNGYIQNNIEIAAGANTITLSGTINYNTGNLKFTSGTIVATGSTLNLSGAGVSITANESGVTLNNVTTTVSTTFNGTYGMSMASLTASTAGSILTFGAANTYTVTSSLTLDGTKSSHVSLVSSTGGTKAAFRVTSATSIEAAYADATDIDSSAGAKIWTLRGILSNTLNWNAYNYPTTQAFTF